MRFLAACLGLLNLLVLSLEMAVLILTSHDLFGECLLPIPLVQPCAVVLGGSFNDSANLRECWKLGLAHVLVMTMGVKYWTHFEKSQISLQLRCEICLWHIKPVNACGFLGLLIPLAEVCEEQCDGEGLRGFSAISE